LIANVHHPYRQLLGTPTYGARLFLFLLLFFFFTATACATRPWLDSEPDERRRVARSTTTSVVVEML